MVKPNKNIFKHYFLWLFVIFTIASLGAIGYSFVKRKYLITPEKACCIECHRLVNPEDVKITDEKKLKTCKDAKELSEVCKKYFSDNQEADRACANNLLSEITADIPVIDEIKPDPKNKRISIAELKTIYGNKVWKGIISGSQQYNNPAAIGKSNYTLVVKELRVNFDHEDLKEPNFSLFFQNSQTLPLKGKGTYQAGHFTDTNACDTYATITPSTVELDLDGYLSLIDNYIIVNFQENQKESTELTLNCKLEDDPMEYYFLLEDLMEINADITRNGDKVTLTGCNYVNEKTKKIIESKGSICKVSGNLDTINN